VAGRAGCKRRVAEEKAVLALIECGSVSQAAKEVGITRKTLTSWLADPGFQESYRQARAHLLETGLSALNGLLTAAARALREALADPEASHAVKIRAAEVVFGRVMQAHEYFELEHRLAALEQAQTERKEYNP